MFVIHSKYLIPKGYRGMAIFPFIFLKDQKDISDGVLVNHEKIHLRQQLELLIVPFFLWYGLEFVFRLIQFKHFKIAYRHISFEKEAYQNETDFNYLKSRRLFCFLKYF